MIIKEEKVNLGRQNEIDVVKTLAIIFMVVVHVYEELSLADTEVLPTTFLDNLIQFLGGPLAAPIFMFALGIGLSYSSHRSPEEFIKRGLVMFVSSYVFNLVRFTIPYLIYAAQYGFESSILIYECFQIDILTFAGLTFLVTGLLKKINIPVFGVLAIAIALQAVGLWISNNVEFNSTFVIYALGVFIKTGYPSYFPFFLWYIYPALGLVFAKYLRHIEDTDKLYLGILTISSAVLVSLWTTLSLLGFDIRFLYTVADDLYYFQNIFHVLFAISLIGIEVSLIHFVLKALKITKMPALIRFMSGKLNEIYIVQWIIIGWTGLVIFHLEPFVPLKLVIPAGIAVTIVSMIIVSLYNRMKKKSA